MTFYGELSDNACRWASSALMGEGRPPLSLRIINSPLLSVTVSGFLTRGRFTHDYAARPTQRPPRLPQHARSALGKRPAQTDGARNGHVDFRAGLD